MSVPTVEYRKRIIGVSPGQRDLIALGISAEPIHWTLWVDALSMPNGMIPSGVLHFARTWVRFGGGKGAAHTIEREFDATGRPFVVGGSRVELYAQLWTDPYQGAAAGWAPSGYNGGGPPILNLSSPGPYQARINAAIVPGSIANATIASRWLSATPVDAGLFAASGSLHSLRNQVQLVGGGFSGAQEDGVDVEPVTLLTICGFNAGASTRWIWIWDTEPATLASPNGVPIFVIPAKGGEAFSLSLHPAGRVLKSRVGSWAASSTAATFTADVGATIRLDAEVAGL